LVYAGIITCFGETVKASWGWGGERADWRTGFTEWQDYDIVAPVLTRLILLLVNHIDFDELIAL
jgi:hypothetical protein